MKTCKKHPTYHGLKRPTINCAICCKIYWARHPQVPRRLLTQIHSDLIRLGVGSNWPIEGTEAVDYLNELKLWLDKLILKS